MKVRVLSDLHLEFYEDPACAAIANDVGCDVVALAGDVSTGVRGIEWAAATFSQPVVYVMGNHEYYGHDATALLPAARECAADMGVHLLERNEVTLGGVRFLGCTLWSGFDAGPFDGVHSANVAHVRSADFRMIRANGRLLVPSTMIEWHQRSRAWLEERLDTRRPAVVITHFAPALRGLHPQFGAGDEMTPYFHNDLEQLMGEATPTWIYGHNHYSDSNVIETGQGETLVGVNARNGKNRTLSLSRCP